MSGVRSRMFFFDVYLLKKVAEAKKGNSVVKDVYSRRSVIIPDFVGITFYVHNGKGFVPVFIKEQMVGHKLGEFAPTRTFGGHPDKTIKRK